MEIMKRRKFLTIAGIGGALAAVGSLRFFTTSFEDSAADLIRNELSFLKLDEEGLKKFTTEFGKDKDRKYKLIVKGYSLFGVDVSKSGKLHNLVSNYLLSSDFFTAGMDESRLVKYVGLYDPYTRPCSHPFSHAYYS
jgi:hypothetical protein